MLKYQLHLFSYYDIRLDISCESPADFHSLNFLVLLSRNEGKCHKVCCLLQPGYHLNFACWVIFPSFVVVCWLFSKLTFFFQKISFRNTIRVSNRLDPDQDRHYIGPDLDPYCLQRLSADVILGNHLQQTTFSGAFFLCALRDNLWIFRFWIFQVFKTSYTTEIWLTAKYAHLHVGSAVNSEFSHQQWPCRFDWRQTHTWFAHAKQATCLFHWLS